MHPLIAICKSMMNNNPSSGNGFSHAITALFFIGTLQVIIGGLLLLSGKEMGLIACIMFATVGGVLIGLGLWAKNTGTKTPFKIGIILCLCYVVLMVITGVLGGIFATAILLFFLIRGIQSDPLRPDRDKFLDEDAPLDSDI